MEKLTCDSAATAVELCAFFDHQSGCSDLASHIRRATEHQFFARENVAFDGSVYLCDRNFNDSFCHFCSGADDEGSIW